MKVPITKFTVTVSREEYARILSCTSPRTLAGFPVLIPKRAHCAQCGVPERVCVVMDDDGWEVMIEEDGREFWAAFSDRGAFVEGRWLDEMDENMRTLIELPFLMDEVGARLSVHNYEGTPQLMCRYCSGEPSVGRDND